MLRGGLSQNFIPYARANLPDKPDYNPELPVSHIYYVDVNSLYASCMRFRLPVSDFVSDYKIRDRVLKKEVILFVIMKMILITKRQKKRNIDIMFENAVNWKQGEIGFFQEVSGYYPPDHRLS